MFSISGQYEGNLRCEMTNETTGAQATTVYGESFETNTPVDLVLMAIGSCTMTMIAYTAESRGIDVKGATFSVGKTMADQPRRVAAIDIVIDFPHDYSDKEKALFRNAAASCPVKNTLSSECKINVTMNFGA